MEKRYRNRGEQCTRCFMRRTVTICLDDKMVVNVDIPKECTAPIKCMEKIRDQALLNPFEDGKVRHGV